MSVDKIYTEAITTQAWAMDFLRAFHERPKLIQWIVWLLLGKYARREWWGMRDSLQKAGYETYWNYGIEKTEYNLKKYGGDKKL